MGSPGFLQESWFKDVPTVQQSKEIDLLPLNEYDIIWVSFSAGKDSLTSVLKLLDMGVPKEKIILAHQNVDGGFQDPLFADWPVTHSYVKAFAEALGLRLEFQYRKRGFLGELTKTNAMTEDVEYTWNGQIFTIPTLKAKISTRLKYPAMSADLRIRWCSSNLKIESFSKMISNNPEYKTGTIFAPQKILFISGERAEESPARAKYIRALLHSTNSRSRVVHHWRMVLDETEEQVWQRIEKHRIMPHYAYILGWSRVSCRYCVFSDPDHLRMLQEIDPGTFYEHVRMEKYLKHTIDPRMNLEEKAKLGTLDRLPKDARTSDWVKLALGREFKPEDIIVKGKWELPAGAFRGNSGGPT